MISHPETQTDRDRALAEALDAARRRHVAANPASAAAHEAATSVLPGGSTRTTIHYSPFPLAMTRGDGCRLPAAGYRLARRGMIALSLPVGEPERAEFITAVSGFLGDYRALVQR